MKCLCIMYLLLKTTKYIYVNNLTIYIFLQKPLYHLLTLIYNLTVSDVCNYCKYSLNYGYCAITVVFKMYKVLYCNIISILS